MSNKSKKPENQESNYYLKTFIVRLLTWVPVLLGLGLLFLSKRPVSPNIVSISFLIIGFNGLIVVVRQEIPLISGAISGRQAVIEGIIITILFWIGAAYIFIYGI
jgi:predicted neutral ceramidase superfamily lipid hydrolase